MQREGRPIWGPGSWPPDLEKELGVSIVTVNKPGANGQIQLTQVASSKPDGYFFGTVNFPVTIMPLYRY